MRSILALSFLIISFAITIHARRHDGVRRHYSTSNDDSRVGSRSQLRGHHRRHSHHQHNFRRKHTWERPVAQGRGILSELVDTKNNVISNLFNLNPVGTFTSLVGGVYGVASEAVSHAGKILGDVQKSISGIVETELNDLNDPDTRDIRFLLFTQKNRKVPEIINLDCEGIEDTNFDKTKGLKVLIHGFSPTGSPIFDVLGEVRNATTKLTQLIVGVFTIKNTYLEQKSEENIIIVDWTSISRTIIYPSAASATLAVGRIVANFLINLYDQGNLYPDKVHLIGFSLGAHLSGTCGRLFHEETGDKLARITGLDPAGPGFDLMWSQLTGSTTAPEDMRYMLDKGDAKFVDIIHTNAKLGGWGMVSNTGTADFFANGGKTQPGCEFTDDVLNGCSHSRSWQYFAESIGSEKYPACKCPSQDEIKRDICKCRQRNEIYMGDLCSTKARGSFYVGALLENPYDDTLIVDLELEEDAIFEDKENFV